MPRQHLDPDHGSGAAVSGAESGGSDEAIDSLGVGGVAIALTGDSLGEMLPEGELP